MTPQSTSPARQSSPWIPTAFRIWPAAWIVLSAAFIVACGPGDEHSGGDTGSPTDGGDAVEFACAPAIGQIDFGCAAPPDTFTTTGLSGTSTGSAWDAWAWSTFAALNWPALASTDTTNYPTGYVRGVPDTGQSFTGASSTDVAVWETFKEKRELFNSLATTEAWQDLTYDPTYAPSFIPGGQIEPCLDIDEALHEQVKAHPRVIAQLGKQSNQSAPFNSGDETAEVASPAQESTNTLCAGLSGQSLTSCRQFLFEPPASGDLDAVYTASEDNSRMPVGPRVFKGAPSQETFLYYEVKLNYDYYRYVAAKGLNDYDTAVQTAQAHKIELPIRTSAQAIPGANSNALARYSAATVSSCYGGQLDGCSSGLSTFDSGTIGASNLPQVGSMQLKAAWLPASLLDGSPSEYHTTSAVYYEASPNQPNGLCYSAETFGLVGLHIIQRVHGGDASEAKGEPIGGTYIFATWEHESIADGAGYSYVQYFAEAGNEQTDPQPYPNTADGIQVARLVHEVTTDETIELVEYPLPSTQAVNSQAHSMLSGDSVWQHYRLIGTQFQAISDEASSLQLGQPYYLANLVVETSRGLQQFQGLPPGVKVISPFSSKLNDTFQFFAPTFDNVAFQFGDTPGAYNMGGCMGCHGVAQIQGFNFSFVLQDGSKGTKPDTADDLAIPPVPVPSPTD